MSGSKKNKKAAAKRRAQHRQAQQVKHTRERAARQEHLPKTGTKADDEYLLRRSREDLLDFGLAAPRRKPLLYGALAVVAVVVVLGLLGWLILT
jgi:hypothetical protein